MTLKASAAAALLAGAATLSIAAPAAHAQNFGIYGACDSGSVNISGNGGGFNASGRDCTAARDWQSKENARDRQHVTQDQLIGLGGNLTTGLIMNAQNRQPQVQPQPLWQVAAPSTTELELMRQQQEIELLKLKLQLAYQQNGSTYTNASVMQPMGGYVMVPAR
ncbi:hypothetical protein KUL97_11940 [Synechococcus sp. HK05]|uniref:hypothetical protein n=1 Tax=Synechococcus sp. HK05 TaxID=2725975 RepID=UPI001C38DDA6|nr:hypothetical protein [Synechococcus sp. HK05]MBV2352418.1 hypothetical protein [Synechococcus sp. HK05]